MTNAVSPDFEPPSPSESSKHLSPDFYTESELIIRTDSFLAKQKMINKIAPYVKTESKVFINHCEVLSQIKSITQSLALNTINSNSSTKNEKLMKSAVYENIVYKWPDLDREPQNVRHRKFENEYYKPEKVNKLNGSNCLEKTAKTELHHEHNHFHGAKVNQANAIKNVVTCNDYNGLKGKSSPDVNRKLKVKLATMDNHELASAKRVNQQPTRDMRSPIKKINSQSDFTKLNKSPKFEREPNYRRGTMDNEFKKTTLNCPGKFSFTENTPSSKFETGQNIRRGTLDNQLRKTNANNGQANITKNNSLPKLDQPFRRGTMDNEFHYITANPNSQTDFNSLKKKPRPLPKPKLTNKISDAIEKLNIGQTGASVPEPELEQNEYLSLNPRTLSSPEPDFDEQCKDPYTTELIYENLRSNMPDDMKAHMYTGDTSESQYLPMQPIRRSLRKRFASDFVPTKFRTDVRTDRVINERISLSYDYVSVDELSDFNFKEKNLPRTLSIPNCFMFGESSRSMHLKGDLGCRHESDEYLYFYVLNPRTIRENVHPFIRKKEKATPMPCYCGDTSTDVDNSQVLYFSCENMAGDDTDYYSVDEVHLFNPIGTDNPTLTRLDESNASSSQQADNAQLEIRGTGMFKKKVNQFKQLITDW